MVRPRRFERLTHSLEGCCSIRLSYGRALKCYAFFFSLCSFLCKATADSIGNS